MINTLEQANTELTKFIPNNAKPGKYNLDNILKFMEFLGNPQNKLKVIHIAGTSGKTSTAYYMASLLKQSGKKVGLSVSPHIHDINERFLINLVPMSEDYFCRQFSVFLSKVDKSKLPLSYFEVLVGFSFWEFYNQKVDYAVIEVGLGGLLDCTNVIDNPRKISVITDIGIDHVKFLGNTIGEITSQKAGIIKPSNEVFMNKQNAEVVNIIKQASIDNKSTLHINEDTEDDLPELNLLEFQIRNFSLANSVFKYLVKRDGLSSLDSLKKQLASKVIIPGRMQIIELKNKTIILDGSHNPQKIKSIVKAIKIKFPNTKIAILAGFKNNTEDIKSCVSKLRLLSDEINLTSFIFGKTNNGKSYDTKLLKTMCSNLGFNKINLFDNPNVALEKLISSNNDHVILVTGTFFLLSKI